MNEYRYITVKQLVASYMDKYKVRNVSFTELKRWSKYIESHFTYMNLGVISLLSKQSILNFETDDLFFIRDKEFCLKYNKNLDNVYEFCLNMPESFLVQFVFKIDGFIPNFDKGKGL